MKDWTIMVYMAADNNLSENMAVALEEIRGFAQTGETDQVNLLAFFDSNSLTAPTQYIDFSDLKGQDSKLPSRPTPYKHVVEKKDLVYKTDANDDPKKVADDDASEGNSASAYSILNFVNWCLNTRGKTAKNYALIFSGHSFGFHGTSFLRDDSAGGFITLFKFRWALEQIQKDFLNGNKLSILGFDSCVMSMLEVGYELQEVAHAMVASEGSLPNSGWSYSPVLKNFLPHFKDDTKEKLSAARGNPQELDKFLKTFEIDFNIFDAAQTLWSKSAARPESVNSEVDLIDTALEVVVEQPGYAKQAACTFVDSLIENHNNLLIGGRSIDIAAWDLNKVDPVVTSLGSLAGKFNEYLDLSKKIEKGSEAADGLQEKDIVVFHELKKIILQSHFDSQTYMNEQCVDLQDFCKRLILECKFMERYENSKIYTELIELAKKVISSARKCVLKSGFSGDEYQFSNGISVFFPWSILSFMLTNYRYRYLKFCRGTIREKAEFEKIENYNGLGVEWYKFLRNYIFRASLRPLRKYKKLVDGKVEEVDGKEVIIRSATEVFSKSNPVWSKSNPVWSKSNPVWSKSNPDASKSNPPWGRSNPDASKSNPDASKSNPDASKSNPDASKGEFGNYLFYFNRFKNFEYGWDICGFADEFEFEEDFDAANEKEIGARE